MNRMRIKCKSKINNKKRCRLCLRNKVLPFGLFDSPNELQNITYWDIINKMCKIKTNSKYDLPQRICRPCSMEVEKCFTFISLCEDSDKILEEESKYIVLDVISISGNAKSGIQDENRFNVYKIKVLSRNGENSGITASNKNLDITRNDSETIQRCTTGNNIYNSSSMVRKSETTRNQTEIVISDDDASSNSEFTENNFENKTVEIFERNRESAKAIENKVENKNVEIFESVNAGDYENNLENKNIGIFEDVFKNAENIENNKDLEVRENNEDVEVRENNSDVNENVGIFEDDFKSAVNIENNFETEVVEIKSDGNENVGIFENDFKSTDNIENSFETEVVEIKSEENENVGIFENDFKSADNIENNFETVVAEVVEIKSEENENVGIFENDCKSADNIENNFETEDAEVVEIKSDENEDVEIFESDLKSADNIENTFETEDAEVVEIKSDENENVGIFEVDFKSANNIETEDAEVVEIKSDENENMEIFEDDIVSANNIENNLENEDMENNSVVLKNNFLRRVVGGNFEDECVDIIENKLMAESEEIIESNLLPTENDNDSNTLSDPLTVCEVCRIKFETEAEYEQHMKTKHDFSALKQLINFVNNSQNDSTHLKQLKMSASKETSIDSDTNSWIESNGVLSNVINSSTNIKMLTTDDNPLMDSAESVMTLVGDDSSTSTEFSDNPKRNRKKRPKQNNSSTSIGFSDNPKRNSRKSPKQNNPSTSTAFSDKPKRNQINRPKQYKITKTNKALCKCLYCEEMCIITKYKKHLTTVHADKKIGCSYCEEICLRPRTLLKHMKERHPGEKIDCVHCDFSTRVHGLYFEHIFEKHTEIFSERKCKFCDYTTISEYSLGRHTSQMHDDKKLFKCDLCEKKFFKLSIKRTHERTHTTTEKELFFCEICGKSYKSKKELLNHIDGHTNDKIIECKVCHKKFNRMDRYTAHKKYHTIDKQFKCKECGAIFTQKISLTSHIKIVHNQIKKYKCVVCNRKVSSPRELNVHMKRHAELKDIKCEVCEMWFVRSYELKQHLVVHTGERRHMCEVCGKSFTQAHALKRHLKIHNNK